MGVVKNLAENLEFRRDRGVFIFEFFFIVFISIFGVLNVKSMPDSKIFLLWVGIFSEKFNPKQIS